MLAVGKQHRNRFTRGLSLAETLVVVALVAILLGITAVSLKSTVSHEGPREMAHSLVADLRFARSEANRSGKLVAYCLPSEGRTNRFSRNAILRRGSQRGHVQKVIPYDQAFNGSIFVGEWPGSALSAERVPVGWETATTDEYCIFFRPDGTAFSNSIPALDGNFPLVVGSKFTPSGGTLAGVVDPHTVWVSGSGNVSLEENKTPTGVLLPPTGTEPTVATLNLSREPSELSPKIESVKFLPEGIPGQDTVGLGQNYVNIHPDQKEAASKHLEYGIATMKVVASDPDGGPLYFDLSAIATDGDGGNFTVSNETGAMDYIYDPRTDQGHWQALISWRPPPGAPEDAVYELQFTVRDEEGNTDTTVSGAGLLPRFATLPPAQMVLQSTDRQLYLANIEGANSLKITKDEEPEYDPFFSPDGTRIYSMHDTPGGGLQLRVRNSDGTGMRILRDFPPNVVDGNRDLNIKFDPTYSYAAYIFNKRPAHYPAWKPELVSFGRTSRWMLLPDNGSIPEVFELEVIHLNSGTSPVSIAREAYGDFFWDGESEHTLQYSSSYRHRDPQDLITPTDAQRAHGIRPYIGNKGHTATDKTSVLDGFPPIAREVTRRVGLNATDLIFNPPQREWYLQNQPALELRGTVSPGSHQIDSSQVRNASWSSDGRFAAYVTPDGEVTVKEVLQPDSSNVLQPVSPRVSFSTSGGNASLVRLSPTGRWVFFLRNGDLYRAINANGATPVKVSQKLGKKIESFAVSQ